MNLFGWLTTGRAFARPAGSHMAPNMPPAAPQNRVQHPAPPLARGWPGPASGGGSFAHGQFPLGYAGRPVDDPAPVPLSAQGYAAQVRQAYLGNAVAQRACRTLAEGVGGIAFQASDPALIALVRARSAGQSLLETVATHILLHGNAYVPLICDADGRPAELIALRPERVAIELDGNGWPAAYRYRAGGHAHAAAGGREWRIPARDAAGRPALAHIRRVHPLDDHYGLGVLASAAQAISLHNAAAQWNIALLANAARPSGALVHDGGEHVLSEAQFARLKAELEAGFAGARNAGRPMLLEGGLKWQAMSLSPADMDFADLRDAAAREIAMAFGVPPMLLGLPGDATYANYREANRALWRHSICPLADLILSGLAELLAPHFGTAGLAINADAIPALAEDRERMWAQVGAADFLTRAEKRSLLGLPVEDAAMPAASDQLPISEEDNHNG